MKDKSRKIYDTIMTTKCVFKISTWKRGCSPAAGGGGECAPTSTKFNYHGIWRRVGG